MTTRRNPATAAPVAVKRPGRPPAAGTQRQVRVSLTLPPEYVDWLDQRGNRSEQVRAMIEREMQQA